MVGNFNDEPFGILCNGIELKPAAREHLIGSFHNFRVGTMGEKIDHIFVLEGIRTESYEVITHHRMALFRVTILW